jgi:hypothetical protein
MMRPDFIIEIYLVENGNNLEIALSGHMKNRDALRLHSF